MTDRAFISFTFPFDLSSRNELYWQSRRPDSPFEVTGWSLSPDRSLGDWWERTWAELEQADLVIALVSSFTRSLSNVRDEVKIAQELGLPVIALRLDANANPPGNIRELHEWTWEGLKELVTASQEQSGSEDRRRRS
jgi:hypothetical protein